MKNQNTSYPNGYAVLVVTQAVHVRRPGSAFGRYPSVPDFRAMQRIGMMTASEIVRIWCAWSRYAFSAFGLSGENLRDLWNSHRVDGARRARQLDCGMGVGRRERADVPFLSRLRGLTLAPAQFKYDRACGIEIECYGPHLADALPIWAREKQDGSLSSGRNGVEFNLLLKREYLEPRLFRFCQLLAGHKVDKTCGLHVHLDMRGKSAERVKKVAVKMDKWLHALQELVPASRRTNQYCRFGISASDRYHAVNLTAFDKFRTLEIRLHSGTCDYTKILSWVRLVELVAAMPKAPKAGLSCLATLESLPMPAHDMAYWMSRHRELNPGIYSTVSTATEAE